MAIITYNGVSYCADYDTATLRAGSKVTIRAAGARAGVGRWDGRQIVDCSAVLGCGPAESDDIYAALDSSLQEDVADQEGAARVVARIS